MIHAPNQEYPNRKFKILKKVGSGQQGQVLLVQAIDWGQNNFREFALKQQQNINKNEIEITNTIIKHQNQYENPGLQFNQASYIIRIYEIFNYNNQTFILMEAGQYDLYTFINQQQITLEQKIKIMKQLSFSLKFFHQTLKLIHRDIKPENFIQVGDEFKLIDFGLSKKIQERFMTLNVGTPLFQAPEQIQGQTNYTTAVDIWSLACVFYELCKAEPLFQGSNIKETQNLILQSNQNYLKDKINSLQETQQLKDLLYQMLQYNPQDRLNITAVIDKLNQLDKFNFTNNKQLGQNFTIQNSPFKVQSIPQQINFPQQLQVNQQTLQNPLVLQFQSQLKAQEEKQNESMSLIQQIMNYMENLKFQEQFIQLTQSQAQIQNKLNDYQNQLQNQLEEAKNTENFNQIIQEQQSRIKYSEIKQEEYDTKFKQYEDQVLNCNQVISDLKIQVEIKNNEIKMLQEEKQKLSKCEQEIQNYKQEILKYQFNEKDNESQQKILLFENQKKQTTIEEKEQKIVILSEELTQLKIKVIQQEQGINQQKLEDQLKIRIQENENQVQQWAKINQDNNNQFNQLNLIINEQLSTIQTKENQIKEQQIKMESLIDEIKQIHLTMQQMKNQQEEQDNKIMQYIEQKFESKTIREEQEQKCLLVQQSLEDIKRDQKNSQEQHQNLLELLKVIQLQQENLNKNENCQNDKDQLQTLFDKLKIQIQETNSFLQNSIGKNEISILQKIKVDKFYLDQIIDYFIQNINIKLANVTEALNLMIDIGNLSKQKQMAINSMVGDYSLLCKQLKEILENSNQQLINLIKQFSKNELKNVNQNSGVKNK
ncbi:unnamed protein product [Paramecium sonneborni]|uniref:non-specific serine/threonine protein kinase n=1 Tax=Paramecium sonneborni TaxID=65129 RepID=A0A8S1PBI7_9CILI|nr:unnamed protein product [Paramecium sonneborni]